MALDSDTRLGVAAALVCLIVNCASLVALVAAGHWLQAFASVVWGFACIVWLVILHQGQRTRDISRKAEAVAVEALTALRAEYERREEQNRGLLAEKQALEAKQ